MDIKWTYEQQQAISLRNRNLLVSAAAGSGKTAVLVERIISMLLDEENKIDIGRLLVATFTEAAAAEMKERIREALDMYLEHDPGNEYLQKQSVLLYNASISTIHSFCLSVIKEHFHEIDLDPSFRIGEAGEIKLIKQDVMDKLLEEKYSSDDNKAFLDFVEKYGVGRNDKAIEAMIYKLYEYSMSTPSPRMWLNQCLDSYEVSAEPASFEDFEFFEIIKRQYVCYLEDAISLIDMGLEVASSLDGPYMYISMLEADKENLTKMKGITRYHEKHVAICGYSPIRLSSRRDQDVSVTKREEVKKYRKYVKDIIDKLKNDFFFLPESELINDIKKTREDIRTLLGLVNDFALSYREKKLSKNILDFNDMEHFALEILTVEKKGKLVPSAIAKEYQDKFIEVMIDEYQDSNYVQEAILTSVSRRSRDDHNVFMVGDIKQSIYRFRLSEPLLFMEKYTSYTVEDSKNQKVLLHKNFRSREEVLSSVNFIFDGIMREDVGGVNYDDKAALYPGAKYEKPNGGNVYNGELLVCGHGKEGEFAIIAKRIKELIQEGQVVDKDTKRLRSVQYRDITILLRTLKGEADSLATYLMDEGIPVYYGSQVGYFDAYEVSALLDYLRIINNGRQDIPLASVLTSPIVGLSAKELATIKASFLEAPFYKAVEEYKGGKDTELANKLDVFWNNVKRYRDMLPYIGIHDLLWKIIEESGYGLYVQGMPGGNQRKANIDMLIEKAAVFETTSYKGIFHFIRYVEELKKYEVEFGEANITDEQSDVVRIMSIHKSKGLEFPIVILAGMSKMFNTQDLKNPLLIHPSLGIGLNSIDLDKRTTTPTIIKNVIKSQLQIDNTGEQLRVLYVALTRAKEKIIMIGHQSEKKIQELIEVQSSNMGISKKPSFVDIITANSYMDWVLPMIMCKPTDVPMDLRIYQGDLSESRNIEQIGEGYVKDQLVNWDLEQVFHQELRNQFMPQLNYSYPHKDRGGIKLKFTVSELKKGLHVDGTEDFEAGETLIKESEVVPLIPRFLQEGELSGATRGNAYHLFMEHVDFSREYTIIELEELKYDLMQSNEMDKAISSVCTKDILGFLTTSLGERMKEAAKKEALYKEQPFVMKADASIVYPIEPESESILVQGIIDLWFEEDGEVVVLDYKTDRVKTSDELIERYSTQLDFYSMALERLTGKKVKEKLIYSFELGRGIMV